MEDLVNFQPGCIKTTLRILGDKWTGIILQELSGCPQTFSSLESSVRNISPRTLSQRLDMLEAENIIEKRLYCPHPPRFKYLLSEKGVELQDVLAKMAEWGAKYNQSDPAMLRRDAPGRL